MSVAAEDEYVNLLCVLEFRYELLARRVRHVSWHNSMPFLPLFIIAVIVDGRVNVKTAKLFVEL